jgi:hypothetical protein
VLGVCIYLIHAGIAVDHLVCCSFTEEDEVSWRGRLKMCIPTPLFWSVLWEVTRTLTRLHAHDVGVVLCISSYPYVFAMFIIRTTTSHSDRKYMVYYIFYQVADKSPIPYTISETNDENTLSEATERSLPIQYGLRVAISDTNNLGTKCLSVYWSDKRPSLAKSWLQ